MMLGPQLEMMGLQNKINQKRTGTGGTSITCCNSDPKHSHRQLPVIDPDGKSGFLLQISNRELPPISPQIFDTWLVFRSTL